MTSPIPYEPRVYSGEIEIEDGGNGMCSLDVPGIEVLYPGERASFQVIVDPESGTATWTAFVEPGPGPRARLLRWQYRLRRCLTGLR